MLINNTTYTDIPFFLTKNEYTNDINVIKGSNTIRSAVKNVVSTIPGERPYNHKFGSRISVDTVFIDQTNRLEQTAFIDEIYRSIYFNESRVTDLNIKLVNAQLLINFKDEDKKTTFNLNTTY